MQTPLVEVIKIVDGQELGLDRWIRFDAMRYGSDKLPFYMVMMRCEGWCWLYGGWLAGYYIQNL